ncbi:MAG: folylpolyglutamate synthase/dihydrofolate synthase family protein [Bryobacterales bacterium]|nr:folylpolyglutamate synthase/dihydrofolate synthase family protein [Bryobacterales bacterium]
MTYPESVRFLYALGNEVPAAKLGLERIGLLLERLENPHRACHFVHVAGTNGKGSVCAMIESALRAAGVRTGLFTSPHLVEPTERIQIAGAPVDAERFTAAFERVHAVAERMLAEGLIECHPTYFETVAAMAFVLFRELAVETAVLEVGLGGRLDATNVVLPRICVITPIDYDHEALLGKAIESIAREKAGILKPGVPAVMAPQRPEAEAVIRARAAEIGAPILSVTEWQTADLDLRADGSRFAARGPCGFRIQIECPLAGQHQVDNAVTAVAALRALDVPPEAIREGIRRVVWPGRLERVAARPAIILDGAHNPGGARALATYIARFWAGRKVWLIYGTMRDKAVSEITGILFPLADEVILTAPAHPRAVRPEAIRELADHPRLRCASSLEEALAMTSAAEPDDVIFITGSLFLVGEARARLLT